MNSSISSFDFPVRPSWVHALMDVETKAIWDAAAEPARREVAKMRQGDMGASFRVAGLLETLSVVRRALGNAVAGRKRGVWAEITKEFTGMQKAVRKEVSDVE